MEQQQLQNEKDEEKQRVTQLKKMRQVERKHKRQGYDLERRYLKNKAEQKSKQEEEIKRLELAHAEEREDLQERINDQQQPPPLDILDLKYKKLKKQLDRKQLRERNDLDIRQTRDQNILQWRSEEELQTTMFQQSEAIEDLIQRQEEETWNLADKHKIQKRGYLLKYYADLDAKREQIRMRREKYLMITALSDSQLANTHQTLLNIQRESQRHQEKEWLDEAAKENPGSNYAYTSQSEHDNYTTTSSNNGAGEGEVEFGANYNHTTSENYDYGYDSWYKAADGGAVEAADSNWEAAYGEQWDADAFYDEGADPPPIPVRDYQVEAHTAHDDGNPF